MSQIQSVDLSIDLMKSLLWQYNDAVRLQKLIELKNLWYAEKYTKFWNDWVVDVFDIRTANEFGLSVWSIILDVPLSFEAAASNVDKIAFGFGPQRNNFTRGNFKRSRAGAIALTTEQKRVALRLRYYQLVTSGNVLEINKFMAYLFAADPLYGLVYVRDNLDMTCTYIFTFYPTSELQLVLNQFDLMPRPSGVKFDYVIESILPFGFSEERSNFNNQNFEPWEDPTADCTSLIIGLDSRNPDLDSDGFYANFTSTSAAGLTWEAYKCVVAQNSDFVDGVVWPVPCIIDWTECNTISDVEFINAALDMRSGGSTYNSPFTFTFTNVPTDEYACKAFVCGTRFGGDSDFGSVTLPGGSVSSLQNYGSGPTNANRNRLRWFIISNNGGTLNGSFYDFS